MRFFGLGLTYFFPEDDLSKLSPVFSGMIQGF